MHSHFFFLWVCKTFGLTHIETKNASQNNFLLLQNLEKLAKSCGDAIYYRITFKAYAKRVWIVDGQNLFVGASIGLYKLQIFWVNEDG